jgi:hypothetical protein
LEGRIIFAEKSLGDVRLSTQDLVVSVHACGGLTDLVLDRAAEAGARLAVLPCCHNLDESDQGNLEGWVDGAMAVDIIRANRLRSKGYRIYTQTIPSEITPKNRLLLAEPS